MEPNKRGGEFASNMTIREHYAGLMLAAIVAKEGCSPDGATAALVGELDDPAMYAKMFSHQDSARAVAYADALLAALARRA